MVELAVNNERVSPYAPREGYKGNAFGWASDMVHIAVYRDDPEGFIKYLNECGGVNCEVFISGTTLRYAANHGAFECIKALFANGVKSDRGIEYWLKEAETPAYGHRATRGR